MMAVDLGFLLFFLAVPFSSDEVFQVKGRSTGRSLLQATENCPLDLEHQNYTIITSQCKEPLFPPANCCAAFKEIACPFSDYLNNASNGCASIMFSYIYLFGNYPAGLFALECHDNKQGLVCDVNNQTNTVSASGGQSNSLALNALVPAVVALLFN